MNVDTQNAKGRSPRTELVALLRSYWGVLAILVLLTVWANGLILVVPTLIARALDAYNRHPGVVTALAQQLFLVAMLICALTYSQNLVQTYASERIARDLRDRFVTNIGMQSYTAIEELTPGKLLTNLTSDVDGVKLFVSQAAATVISSALLTIGSSVMLLTINWRLGLSVLGVIPLIGGTFVVAIRKMRLLFMRAQEAIDWLNAVVNESIVGATIIRILHSQHCEVAKFDAANAESRDTGIALMRIGSSVFPVVAFALNLATVIILLLGGHVVMRGSMTLGEFAAFNTYLETLIFPIILLGVMSNVIARAATSTRRLQRLVVASEPRKGGTLRTTLCGDVALQNVSLAFGEKQILKRVSFFIPRGSNTAIVGPTGAGKTQLVNILAGLLQPTAGTVTYDHEPIEEYDKRWLYQQIGIAFQDSSLFQMTLRENIAFGAEIPHAQLQKAIAAAELSELVVNLPHGLDSVVSERGTTLSGGQKQRVALARALALDPKVLLLDNFTAHIDTATERAILKNINEQYPSTTLISVTQNIASAEKYDQVILLISGETRAIGTHDRLMETSAEYVEMYDFQRSTALAEVPACNR